MITVEVKKVHIERGHPGSGQWCAISRAASDRVPKALNVFVTRESIEFRFPKRQHYSFPLPEHVTEKQVAFDVGDGMEPFMFDINTPDIPLFENKQ